MLLKTQKPLTYSQRTNGVVHRMFLENSGSSVNFPNGFKGSDGVNLPTEPAILNGICCPPQDPFKLSAQAPLLKAQIMANYVMATTFPVYIR